MLFHSLYICDVTSMLMKCSPHHVIMDFTILLLLLLLFLRLPRGSRLLRPPRSRPGSRSFVLLLRINLDLRRPSSPLLRLRLSRLPRRFFTLSLLVRPPPCSTSRSRRCLLRALRRVSNHGGHRQHTCYQGRGCRPSIVRQSPAPLHGQILLRGCERVQLHPSSLHAHVQGSTGALCLHLLLLVPAFRFSSLEHEELEEAESCDHRQVSREDRTCKCARVERDGQAGQERGACRAPAMRWIRARHRHARKPLRLPPQRKQRVALYEGSPEGGRHHALRSGAEQFHPTPGSGRGCLAVELSS
mmetsp:Transcript_14469/g.49433  ORF Transcript_14469/g.49433 Transcript_14469/m.49433 type:complete len:301 (+) Transcript_14469:220-1122(+)